MSEDDPNDVILIPVPPEPAGSSAAAGPGLSPWLIGGGVLGGIVLLAVIALVLSRVLPKPGPTQVASSAVAATSAAPAAQNVPQSLKDAAAQIGLLGVWADDCSQPASANNEYETYAAASDGTLSDVIDSGPDLNPNNYRWDTGHLIGSDQIALDGVFLRDNSGMHIIVQMANGRMHVLQSTDGSGKQLVVDGAFPAGGAPSWQTKCSGG